MKKNKKNILKYLFVLEILLVWIVCLIVWMKRDVIFEKKNVPAVKDVKEISADRVFYGNLLEDEKMRDSYLLETEYKGTEDYLSGDLFKYEFKKSKGYIQNKDFVKEINSEELESVQKCAKTFIETLVGTGYRSLQEDTNAYRQTILAYCNNQSIWDDCEGNECTLEEYISKMTEWITKYHTKMDIDFITADSLVYKDIYTFVRGELLITVYDCDDVSLIEQQLGIHIKVGETYRFICEMNLYKENTNETGYVVNGVQLMNQIL